MMQRTFGPIVGLDPVVQVGPHPDDDIICSDGTSCKRRHAFIDCKGEPHSNDEDRVEANNQIVANILDDRVRWVEEYCTENADYADGYFDCINDDQHAWPDPVGDWVWTEGEDHTEVLAKAVEEGYLDLDGWDDTPVDPNENRYDDVREYINDFGNIPSTAKIVEHICEELDANFDCEPVNDSDEYATFYGEGCCLGSFAVGEYEEQVEINHCDELCRLHNDGELNDCLDEYNGDGYVSRQRRRVKNKETGNYEYVGEETYDPYGSEYPDITMYTNPGGQWYFVVDNERMHELLHEALIELTTFNK